MMSRVAASPSATFLAAWLARSARFLTSVAPAGLVAKASRSRVSAVEHLTAARNDRSLLNWMSEMGRKGPFRDGRGHLAKRVLPLYFFPQKDELAVAPEG